MNSTPKSAHWPDHPSARPGFAEIAGDEPKAPPSAEQPDLLGNVAETRGPGHSRACGKFGVWGGMSEKQSRRARHHGWTAAGSRRARPGAQTSRWRRRWTRSGDPADALS